MKQTFALAIIFGWITIVSCSKKSANNSDDPAGIPVKTPTQILSSFNSWWNYTSGKVKLFENFTAYDTASKEISKDVFMQHLATAEYIPVKMIAKDSEVNYKLHKLGPKVEQDIRLQLRSWVKTEFEHYEMEGKPLPGLDFKDINGKIYNTANTKGKIVVLKCWFIGCVPCVAEMPELNKVVARYKDRQDVIFVSLASDPASNLQNFLKKKTFDYAVVPKKGDYMSDELNINMFPTHLIINKEGLVTTVVNDAKDLITALDEEAGKSL